MKKFAPSIKASVKSRYLKEPFTIGREGSEFCPKTFGDARGTEKKSVPTKGKL